MNLTQVEFACEAIWPWAFVCWKIIIFLITVSNFLLVIGVNGFYFLLVLFWKAVLVLEFVHFLEVVHFIGI